MNAQPPISETNRDAARDKTNDISISTAFFIGNAYEALASSIGEGKERDTARPSCLQTECTKAMHELANSVTAVLVNTQVMEVKLPPYSQLKRLAREIERHAQ